MARDITEVALAGLICRGSRMTKAQVVKHFSKMRDDAVVEQDIALLEKRLKAAAWWQEIRQNASALIARAELAEGDIEAQRIMLEETGDYHTGCGVDLRDQLWDLLQEHGRTGERIEYTCDACGAPHTHVFGSVPGR